METEDSRFERHVVSPACYPRHFTTFNSVELISPFDGGLHGVGMHRPRNITTSTH